AQGLSRIRQPAATTKGEGPVAAAPQALHRSESPRSRCQQQFLVRPASANQEGSARQTRGTEEPVRNQPPRHRAQSKARQPDEDTKHHAQLCPERACHPQGPAWHGLSCNNGLTVKET